MALPNGQKPPIPEVRKPGRRPVSNYATLAKRRLGQNTVGLKDLLFKTEKFNKDKKPGKTGSSRSRMNGLNNNI